MFSTSLCIMVIIMQSSIVREINYIIKGNVHFLSVYTANLEYQGREEDKKKRLYVVKFVSQRLIHQNYAIPSLGNISVTNEMMTRRLVFLKGNYIWITYLVMISDPVLIPCSISQHSSQINLNECILFINRVLDIIYELFIFKKISRLQGIPLIYKSFLRSVNMFFYLKNHH